jgi:cell division protein FtsQ
MQNFWGIMKKVLIVSGSLTAVGLFIFLLTSANARQQQLNCSKLIINIDYENGLSFITEEDISSRINFLSGDSIIGRRLASVDFRTLEKEICKNPFVDSAEIYVDQQQQVVVSVVQKRPILRIINSDGVSYYLSNKREIIPVTDIFTAHVPIALGFVDIYNNHQRDSTVRDALWKLVTYASQDTFLNALVDQVEVKEDGELLIIPKWNYHTVLLGRVDNKLEEKLNRLKDFYKEGLTRVGWKNYSQINLKYDNQVVCVKRDTTTMAN